MAKDTDTLENTSLQTGTTPNPFSSNAQDFSGSDDEIMDNFAEGPDDGIPMGVGGEKGKQSEPASNTLEADIVNGTTKQPDKASEATAGDVEPEDDAGETGSVPEPEDSSVPEPADDIPQMLLQMAGYADAEAAKADGLGTPEALTAFIRGRGQLLKQSPAVKPANLYVQQEPPVEKTETPGQPDAGASEFKPFELSEDDVEILDEQLQDTIRRMNEHNQRQFDALRQSLTVLADDPVARAEEDAVQFDKAVQSLGDEWQEVFGEGDVEELARRGQTDPTARLALEYRRELFAAVQSLREANSQQGFDPMDLQREIGFGLMHRFPDRFQQLLSGKPAKSNGTKRTSLNRPVQRRAPGATQDALLAKLHKKHPNAGFTATDDDDLAGEF